MLPPELVRTERLRPLEAKPTGELITIDRGIFAELLERMAQAVAAAERGNNRSAGVKHLWFCTDAIFRTGIVPAACAPAQ